MDELPDEELVASYRTQASSPQGQAFLNELFRRHHTRVALWCFRLTGDRESAADLAQDVFIKAFRNMDSYRGESKFSTWLYSITRNHCFNEIKSRSTNPQHTGEPFLFDMADDSANALSQLEKESSARALKQLIQSSLTELEAQVMTLHYAEDVPLESVTRLLKLDNTSGAKAYIVSAKRKLKHAIERWKARQQKTMLGG